MVNRTMTRGRRLIEDFLLPALNNQSYGDLLKWVDKDKCYFTIRWSHKNGSKWTMDDTAVFQDWDKLKGRYHPDVKGYFMQAKQRFRAALYKLNSVHRVHSDDKSFKKYQLVLDPEKRKSGYSAKSKQPGCRVPVITIGPHAKNKQVFFTSSTVKESHASSTVKESYASSPEQEVYASSPEQEVFASSPERKVYYAPPVHSDEHDDEAPQNQIESSKSPELIGCIHDYMAAQMNQRNQSVPYQFSSNKDSPLRDFNDRRDISNTQKMPHIPAQPAPVYSVPSTRFESPKILLVRTYNEVGRTNKKEVEDDYDFDMVNYATSDCALNLSTRSNDSDANSR